VNASGYRVWLPFGLWRLSEWVGRDRAARWGREAISTGV